VFGYEAWHILAKRLEIGLVFAVRAVHQDEPRAVEVVLGRDDLMEDSASSEARARQ